MAGELWLIRHGETEWSRAGKHTGRTDVPLTPEGERQAASLGPRLAGRRFSLVLTSPLQRARRTCELAGFGEIAINEPNLMEWDYGSCEGLTSDEIRTGHPGWTIFADGAPGGETLGEVASRAQTVIRRGLDVGGDVALFGHGHILRVLTACWLGLEPDAGRCFALLPASISTLGYEHEARVITRWNLSTEPRY